MVDDKTSAQVTDEARKALFEAALKAAQYLNDTFTPVDAQTRSGEQTLTREGGKEYRFFKPERADIALRLLEIAFLPRK
jgi:hypothetical protein